VTILYWFTSVAALVGVWLNIHRHIGCFIIWSLTNAIWTYADIAHGIYAQAALQAVYFALSLYGFAKWRKEGES
jgi:hypothetical protein